MNYRDEELRKVLPKWCGSGIRTADAAGGRVLVYAEAKRQLSARSMRTVGIKYGKNVSFTAGPSASVCFSDCDGHGTSVPPLNATNLRNQMPLLLPADAIVRISELSLKVSGPVTTLVIELQAGTKLSATLCNQLLATPRVVDVKFQGNCMYILQARPSQVRTSLDFIGSTVGFRAKERVAGKRRLLTTPAIRRRRRRKITKQ